MARRKPEPTSPLYERGNLFNTYIGYTRPDRDDARSRETPRARRRRQRLVERALARDAAPVAKPPREQLVEWLVLHLAAAELNRWLVDAARRRGLAYAPQKRPHAAVRAFVCEHLGNPGAALELRRLRESQTSRRPPAS